MTTLAPARPTTTLHRVAPLIADAIAVVLYLLLSGWLVSRFSRSAARTTEILDFNPFINAGILVIAHLVFLVGIARLRKLPGKSAIAGLDNRAVPGAAGIVYAVAFVFGLAYLTGYIDSLFTVAFGDMGNAYYFLMTPAIYFMVGLMYLFLLRQPVDSAENNPTALIDLTLINVMLVATATFLQAILATSFEAQSPIILAVLSYGILLTLFILPRLIYTTRTRNWLALLSFDILLLILVAIPILLP